MSNVWSNVERNVVSNVRHNVWRNVRSDVESEKIEYFSFCDYGTIADFGWLAYDDFFERIGLKYKNDSYNKLKELMRSGIYDMVQLDRLCIVCSMPSIIKREITDGIGRLHCEDGVAIRWDDGYELNYLWGVYFDPKLYQKVINRKLNFRQIMELENLEQRMCALKLYDPEKLLKDTKARLLDGKTKKGNELYLIETLFDEPAYFLKYSCPSTGRVYISGIDPDFAEGKNADECMAWKHYMTLDEYNKLSVEA